MPNPLPTVGRSAQTLLAEPTTTGFFGLSQLQQFTDTLLEPFAREGPQATLTLDFSFVRVWDVAALLWLVVALHHYQHNSGLQFSLRLPEGNDAMRSADRDGFDKSADYLRRWRFDTALLNIVQDVSDVDSVLVKEQKGYFERGPRRFYLDSNVVDERGLLQSLISRRLVEIRNLVDLSSPGPRTVTTGQISDCVKRFQSERIGDILYSQCGIDKRQGDLFSDHLLTEALMNVREHPQASMGMVAISVMGGSKELILTVVDNGDPIPKTIYQRFRSDEQAAGSCVANLPQEYCHELLDRKTKADLIQYAMLPGITRKTECDSPSTGMGLTYIHQDTLDTFHGKLRLLADSVCLRCSGSSEDSPKAEEWSHSWRGNLLRIAIPIKAAHERTSASA